MIILVMQSFLITAAADKRYVQWGWGGINRIWGDGYVASDEDYHIDIFNQTIFKENIEIFQLVVSNQVMYQMALHPDIHVTNGEPTIGFYTEAPGGGWASFDHVKLKLTGIE